MKQLFTSLILLFSLNLFAAVPGNDDCANAIELIPGSTCTSTAGTVEEATNSSAPGQCATIVSMDVWYTFTATTNEAKIKVTASPGFDPVLQISSDCNSSPFLCKDNNPTGNDEVLTTSSLIIGNTYYIRISQYGSVPPSTFTFSVCVESIPVASNDICSNAIMLTPGTGSCSASTDGSLSTSGTGINGCSGNASDDVWYSFVANSTDMYITVSPDFDAVIEVFTGCGGTQIACSDQNSVHLTSLTNAQTYIFRVYEYYDGIPFNKNFNVCVHSVIPPANDLCANAIALTPGTETCGTSLSGTILGASGSGGCTGNANEDVWYSFTANGPSMVLEATANFNAVIEVMDACSGNSLGCSNSGKIQVNELNIGTDYLARVYDFNAGEPLEFAFDICAYSISNPANDNCASAQLLTIGTTANSTLTGATPDGYVTCGGTPDDDVWFKFIATQNTHGIVLRNFGPDLSPVIQVYSSCGGTSLACVNASSLPVAGLSPGVTYYVRVFSTSSSTLANPVFQIAVITPVANDECTNAVLLTVNTAPVTGNTEYATESQSPCAGYSDDDVWYQYIPSIASGDSIEVTGDASFDAIVELRDGCAGGNSVDCMDITSSGELERIITDALTTGNTYYIRVYNYSPSLATTPGFSIEIKHSILNSTTGETALSQLSVYPNPVLDVLNIENVKEKTFAEFIDVQGVIRHQEYITGNFTMNPKNTGLSEGVYSLRLSSESGVLVKKIILR